jgi:hypothetical protein
MQTPPLPLLCLSQRTLQGSSYLQAQYSQLFHVTHLDATGLHANFNLFASSFRRILVKSCQDQTDKAMADA